MRRAEKIEMGEDSDCRQDIPPHPLSCYWVQICSAFHKISQWIWESQFLGRLIRSPGSPRRRKGSGALEVEIGVWNSKEEERTNLFCVHSLVNYTTQFKLCTRDYTTTVYPDGGQFLLPENLLTNPDILECILWEWVWRIFLLLNSNLVILKCKLWEWVW